MARVIGKTPGGMFSFDHEIGRFTGCQSSVDLQEIRRMGRLLHFLFGKDFHCLTK